MNKTALFALFIVCLISLFINLLDFNLIENSVFYYSELLFDVLIMSYTLYHFIKLKKKKTID